MIYRVVNGYCAFDFGCLDNQCQKTEVYQILKPLGIRPARLIPADLVRRAEMRVGRSQYANGAPMAAAPDAFDCSSFTKWCYAQVGIWLPRLAVQQFECGQPVTLDNLLPGDLVFFTGPVNCWNGSPDRAVGHVALYAGSGTIIHATCAKGGVVESPLDHVVRRRRDTRGARRVVVNPADTQVMKCPPELEIETSDDIRWLILRSLPKPAPAETA